VAPGGADPEVRETARGELQSAVDGLAPWAQAWASFALGESLLHESGVGRQQLGMVNLARLPATFSASQPYLAGLSLARLAEVLEAGGETEVANGLRNELRRAYPNHPVLARFSAQASFDRSALARAELSYPSASGSP
jgi:hypothetical protein